MKTGFLFLLQTIYLFASCVQIPRAIGAFYDVWKWHNVQRATSEMGRCRTHAIYRSKLWQQDHCQHPQNANLDNRDVPSVMKTKFPATVMVFGVVSSDGHIMPPHIFEVGLKVNTKVYLDMVKSVVIPWYNLVAGGRLWVWQQDSAPAKIQRDPGLDSEGVLWLCTLLSLVPLLPQPEPAGLLRLVIRREHHQHDLPQHQSQPDRCHPPSICRAPAGACERGILPVPDLYRGSDWV